MSIMLSNFILYWPYVMGTWGVQLDNFPWSSSQTSVMPVTCKLCSKTNCCNKWMQNICVMSYVIVPAVIQGVLKGRTFLCCVASTLTCLHKLIFSLLIFMWRSIFGYLPSNCTVLCTKLLLRFKLQAMKQASCKNPNEAGPLILQTEILP